MIGNILLVSLPFWSSGIPRLRYYAIIFFFIFFSWKHIYETVSDVVELPCTCDGTKVKKKDVLRLWKSSIAEETKINVDVSLCMKSSLVFMFLFSM